MKHIDIVKNKKHAATAAWAVFMLCTLIMFAMSFSSCWASWVNIMLVVHAAVLTFLTFNPRTYEQVQPVALTIFSFSNIFACSLMENDIYPSIAVFVCAEILVAVYRSVRLLAIYISLIVGGVLYHIFALNSVSFETTSDIIVYIVRISVMLISGFFLILFIRNMNRNEEGMEKSVEEARKAEQYKSDFLANMSHEIRTPMNAIIGMCELILRENTLSDSARENCYNIQASGRSLLAIINDILDFSKIESGKMELIDEEFNIASTINDVIVMSEARRGSKEIEIFVNAEPDIPCGLMGDEVRIRQIIVNLMTNAIKYTERGSVTLTISHTKQDYGINLLVSVKDTGAGITEENMEKLFTSFRRIDTKKNRSIEGTGLGLAISKQLVNQMGGFINVSSEYGVGSEFSFVIPLHVKDNRPFAAVKQPEKVHAVGFFCGETYKNLFEDLGKRLNLDFRCCNDPAELDRENPTHFFVCRDRYFRYEDYFASVSEKAEVFVIQDRVDAVSLPQKIKSVFKPFYSLVIVGALNGENLVLNLNERHSADAHFTAPKARVLIVDDNPINLKVAAGLMRPYNMQIITAESGPAAINMLRSRDIDLVFMDHMMPEMDGVEAVQIIRATEGDYYRNLPIIALTANAVNGAREMFLKSGFNDFLAKPMELSALDRILRNYLPKEYMHAPSGQAVRSSEIQTTDNKRHEEPVMFDPGKGMSYTGGDKDAYREILELYVRKGQEKRGYIEELFLKKDWKNYIIEIHALKSTSMSIGAIKLSELAKELEAAGKAKSYGSIERKNAELLQLYGEVIDTAKEYLGDIPSEKPQVYTGELTEIDISVLEEYVRQAKKACSAFDGDVLTEIAEETKMYCFKGEPLSNYFGKASELAEDFEYEAAEAEIKRLDSMLEDR